MDKSIKGEKLNEFEFVLEKTKLIKRFSYHFYFFSSLFIILFYQKNNDKMNEFKREMMYFIIIYSFLLNNQYIYIYIVFVY